MIAPLRRPSLIPGLAGVTVLAAACAAERPPASAERPPERRVLTPTIEPAYSFMEGGGMRFCLVGETAAVELRCRGGFSPWEAGFAETLPRTIELALGSGQLFEGDFRGQWWLAPSAGPARPYPPPTGRPLEVEGQVLEVFVDAVRREPDARVEVRLPTLVGEDFVVRFDGPLSLAVRGPYP